MNDLLHNPKVSVRTWITFTLIVLISAPTVAQVDSVSVARNNLLISKIKAGKSSYAVWSKDNADGSVSQISIWNREVFFSRLNGKEVIVVRQMRYYNDPTKNKYVYTISDRRTLQTIYDYTTRGSITQAFNYTDQEITGADSVKNNTKNDFRLAIHDFPFCFEMDLETLSLLPIKRVGQKFTINFYHPGGETLPKYYPVDVVGQEDISITNALKVVCWKIQLHYPEGGFDFSWISKDSHELIKLEGHHGNTVFNKVKLSLPVI